VDWPDVAVAPPPVVAAAESVLDSVGAAADESPVAVAVAVAVAEPVFEGVASVVAGAAKESFVSRRVQFRGPRPTYHR